MNKAPLIIGWAHTKFGKLQATREELLVEAATAAIEHAGLQWRDVDVIHVGTYNHGFSTQGFEAALVGAHIPELATVPAHHHESACATGSAAIFAAYDSIAAKRHKVALVLGVEKMSGVSGARVNDILLSASFRQEEEKFGSFAGVFGQVAQIYADRYTDPFEAMARIAAKNHANGALNPLAHMQKDLGFAFCNTVSDQNPQVAGLLRRADCSLVSDGAAALIVAAPDVCPREHNAVRWLGMGNANDALPLSRRDPLEFAGARAAMTTALEIAGLNIEQLSFLETHDCFTIAELLQYEAFGLAERGLGAEVINEGRTLATGDLPVNPSGGLKAKGHPVGTTGVSMHAIACMQLTETFPGLQISEPEFAGVFNMGGMAVSNFASILERVS